MLERFRKSQFVLLSFVYGSLGNQLEMDLRKGTGNPERSENTLERFKKEVRRYRNSDSSPPPKHSPPEIKETIFVTSERWFECSLACANI